MPPTPDKPGTDLPDVEDDNLDEQEHDDAELDDDLDDDAEGDEQESDEDDAEDGDDKPLGPKGEKALATMKATLKETKKALREAKAQIAELRKGDDGEEDELTSTKKQVETEREKRIEAEKKLAARTAGLPESWAKRLEGDDFDDFLDDAETLAEDMPKTPRSRKGGGGAKDGGRKGAKAPSLDDQIAEAEKSGDLSKASHLKAQKVHEMRKNA